MIAILSSTYFGPIQWYRKLAHYEKVLIENCDSYQKQTYRNRCLIMTTNGVQTLTVPVNRHKSLPVTGKQFPTSSGELGSEVVISDHGKWQHLHWNALVAAYSESPFFEFYADDIKPLFDVKAGTPLYRHNLSITLKICELIDIHPDLSFTGKYVHDYSEMPGAFDFRTAITPKNPIPDNDLNTTPYYQVFGAKHGFTPNMSILDLLFNMGPESIFYL